jgi:hypothetical protein
VAVVLFVEAEMRIFVAVTQIVVAVVFDSLEVAQLVSVILVVAVAVQVVIPAFGAGDRFGMKEPCGVEQMDFAFGLVEQVNYKKLG